MELAVHMKNNKTGEERIEKMPEEKRNLIQKLSDIHESVKNNKYRIDHEVYGKYGLGYYDYLSDMNKIFNDIRKLYTKEDAGCQFAHLGWNFYHDFQADITMSRADLYWILRGEPLDEDPFAEILEKEENIERAIGYIHAFLQTGRFDSYCFWYRREYVQMDWNEEKGIYLPGKIVKHYKEEGPHFTLEELRQDFEEDSEKEM